MVRAYGRLERRLEQVLLAQGLSLPQFDVLATLAAGEGISQQELADRLLVTKGNVCGLLDRVESGGWVERRPDARDRRTKRLFLTPAGRAMLKESAPMHRAVIKQAMTRLRPADIRMLFQLLDRLEDGVEG